MDKHIKEPTTVQNLSRKNHYVHKVYLKQWTDENNELCVYDLVVSDVQVPKWKKSNIKTVGVWRNFYVNVYNEEESDFIEHNLDEKVENPSETPLAKAANGDRLNSDDFTILIYFVYIQLIRTPSFLKFFL